MISKGDSLLRHVIFEMKEYDFHFSYTISTTWSHIRKMGLQYCCVFQCESNSKTIPKLKFHTIPAKPVKRKRWIEQIAKHSGFRSALLGDYTVTCSRQFSEDCYTA